MGYSYKPSENKFLKVNIYNIANWTYFVYYLLFLFKCVIIYLGRILSRVQFRSIYCEENHRGETKNRNQKI